MRDTSSLQRRRRVLKFNSEPPSTDGVLSAIEQTPSTNGTEHLVQLFRDCQGRLNLKLIIEVSGKAHPCEVSLDRPFVVIGSDEACNIVIRHRGVLPRHAYVQWIDGQVFCCSLSGYEQNKLAGMWISRKPTTLGPLRLSVPGLEERLENSDPRLPSPELTTEIPQVQLKFSGVEQRDNLWPVDRRLTLIGRGADCRLRLDDSRIAPIHASLIRTATSCWLIDLSDLGQVVVNGHRGEFASLDIGDTIQMGPFVALVSTTPFSLRSAHSNSTSESQTTALRKLAAQHRQRMDSLDASLGTVKSLLEAQNLDATPELKAAWQKYASQVSRHHREMQSELECLSGSSEAK